MNEIHNNSEVLVKGLPDFDLAKTFECGQCFRWEQGEGGAYTGIAHGRVLHLRQDGSDVYFSCAAADFDAVWRGYFDLDRDYAHIRERLCVSGFMRHAADFGAGIRILHQEPWEALCSFIISQNNHIPRIKKIIAALCKEFGESIISGDKTYYSFPTASRLANLNEDDLAPLRCGYRAKYIIGAAKAVADKAIDLDALPALSQDKARFELKKLPGVGDKVADCVLLFGLHMLDAFPVDVWIKRALDQYCGSDFDIATLHPYAGIAQQYIFHYVRNR